MNHRLRYLCPLVVLLLCATPAAAQIKNDWKQAPNAAPFAPQIAAHVQRQVARLADESATNVRSARQDLEMQAAGTPAPTPSYLAVYAAAVDTATAALANDKRPAVRLNAAIVVARVAARANNTALANAALKFASDPNEGVALWGVKAARYILPGLLQIPPGPGAAPLPGALVAAVKRHPGSGPLAAEAYDALRMNIQVAPANINNQMIQSAVPHVLEILAFRVGLYPKGIPAQPTADTAYGTSFLFMSKVWGQMTGEQQSRLIQLLSDLISGAGQHVVALPGNNRWSLLQVLSNAGGALQVVADPKETALVNVAKDLRGMAAGTPIPVVTARVQAVYPALKASARWGPTIKPPPPLQVPPGGGEEDEETEAPATAPAAGTSTGTPAGEPAPGAGGPNP